MKDKLNTIYQELLLTHGKNDQAHLLALFYALLENIKNPALLGSLWKATVKTLIKLMSFKNLIKALKSSPEFDSQQLLKTLMEAQFETVDHQEEEQMLLLIQKAILRSVTTLSLQEDLQFKIFRYFLTILKKKSIYDLDQTYSVSFADNTKKNLHKVLYHFMGEDEEHQVKVKIFEFFFVKIKKTIIKIQNKHLFENKLREFTCFSIKTLEDCFKKIGTQDELRNLILTLKHNLVETLCIAAEYDDIIIRNQSQQAFTMLLKIIIECQIDLREELEVLLAKIALKPALKLLKKIGISDINKSNLNTQSANGSSKLVIPESPKKQEESDEENEEFIRINHERSVQDDLLLEININYLLETLLLLKPEQLSSLFLLYDCQPFSENIITKSLVIILRVAQQSPEQYCQIYKKLVDKFSNFNMNPKISEKLELGGPSTINFMMEQKSQIKKLAKDANTKFKNFLKKIDDLHAYADQLTPAEVASKILVYSRDIQIDKVTEIIGGKDDKAKLLLNQYLSKMEFAPSEIEQSLRKFLQTFRLAGVDSQTCQHNPNIKMKTGWKAFLENCHTVCPQSKHTIPEEFFERIYHSVTDYPFYAPSSKSLIEENYNIYNKNEIDIRLSKCQDKSRMISENEFINSADLTQNQLFHYSNSLAVPPTLIPIAARHLITFLTQKFMKYNVVTHASQINTSDQISLVKTKFDVLEQLANLNKKFNNNESVDRIYQVIFKVIQHSQDEDLYKRLENLVWSNFDCLKRSLVLLPKLSMQTFMKDDIKETVNRSFISVMRLYQYKHQERQRLRAQHGQKGDGKQVAQKQTSFFDLVYNYFTENTEEESQEEKKELLEIDAIKVIRRKILMEDKEGDYMEYIEETFDEKTGQQLVKQKSRLQELITMICQCVRETLNQEEGILCLAFLSHLIKNSEKTLDNVEKIWIELHLLITSCLKTKQVDPQVLSRSSSQNEEKKQEYEVISTDTSQDSIDVSAQVTSDDLEIFHKETCPIKMKVIDTVTRHMIMDLHLTISKQLSLLRSDNQHIIRDVQRMVSSVIETELVDKNHENVGVFDDIQFLNSVYSFIEGDIQLLSKFLRLILILVLRSTAKKIDEDDSNSELILARTKVFKAVSNHLAGNSSALPFDQISLALEIFQKIQIPNVRIPQSERILENMIFTMDNLSIALQKQMLMSDEAKRDHWFKMISIMQDKILFNPVLRSFEMTSIQCVSAIKNLALNHPFQIEKESLKYIKKLFSDILYKQTFENLNQEQIQQSNQGSNQLQKLKEEVKAASNHSSKNEEDIQESAEEQLEQLCQICVNNISDIFIYYVSMILKEPSLIHEIDTSKEEESVQKLFSFLWLNLLKVLLHFGERSNNIDFQGLIHSVHDNIKRVIEFLIQLDILKEDSQNQEMARLWKTTWDIVTAFFSDMKVQVLGPNHKDKN
eukprot:403333278